MLKLGARLTLFTLTAWSLASAPIHTQAGPLQVYGAWHCGNHACTWSAPRTPTEFDAKNRWLIDRGDYEENRNPNLAVSRSSSTRTALSTPTTRWEQTRPHGSD